jgi:hypothetical protein
MSVGPGSSASSRAHCRGGCGHPDEVVGEFPQVIDSDVPVQAPQGGRRGLMAWRRDACPPIVAATLGSTGPAIGAAETAIALLLTD